MLLINAYALESGKPIEQAQQHNIASIVVAAIEGAYQLASAAAEVTPNNYAAVTVKDMLFSLLEK